MHRIILVIYFSALALFLNVFIFPSVDDESQEPLICPDRKVPIEPIETPSTVDPISAYHFAPEPTPERVEKILAELSQGPAPKIKNRLSMIALPSTVLPFYRFSSPKSASVVGSGAYVHPVLGYLLDYTFDLSKYMIRKPWS